MYDLIIIGSGPAGLSAAIYGKRAGLSLLVLEKNPMSGGQVLNTYEVDNYLGMPGTDGFDMGMKFREHADKMGVEFREAAALSIEDKGSSKMVHTTEGDLETKTVILATGAAHATLDVEGEEKFSGKGVSYCATCDGMFFRGKKVAVVGGGNTALEDAAFLSNYCEKVYLIHRRDTFRGEEKLVRELQAKENVEFQLNKTVLALEGELTLQAAVLYDKISGEESRLEIDGLFVAIGQVPETEVFAGLVERDENGYIVAGEDCHTSIDGIFAAGDCRKKTVRQLTTAAADGAVAALAAAQL